MGYVKQVWADDPSTTSPISAARLNHLETQYDAAMTDAAAAYVAKGSKDVNVKDYGAVGNGSTDDTAAIQSAINAAATNGGPVFIPRGVFVITGPLTVSDGVTLRGISKYNTVLSTSSATANMLTMGNATGLENIKLTASVTRTAGIFVDVRGNGVFIDNCQITEYWVGISVGVFSTSLPVMTRISNNLMSTTVTVATGAAIQLLNFANTIIHANTITGPTLPGTQPGAGIRISNGDTVVISDTNVTQHGRALHVNTPTGQHCFALSVVNCLFDSAGTLISGGTVSCVDFNGVGNAYDTKFANCWFGLSAAQSGVSLSGAVDGITFTGCEFVKNGSSGLVIGATTVKNVVVTGGFSTGNVQYGIFVAAGATAFTITGHRAGDISGRGPNGFGVVVSAGASDGYSMVGNNLRGNTTANLTDSGTGVNKVVASNLV